MEQFTEEHSKLLLSKEWMVKTDTVRSTPYLLKFYHSPADLSCFIFITDTKLVWAEVLTSNQFSRRWRHCNPDSPPLFPLDERENSWRTTSLEHLSKIHSLGAISDFTFDIVESNYAVSCASTMSSLSFTESRILLLNWKATDSSGDGRHAS